MTLRPLIITLALAGTVLAGCGKTGILEQPAPMFGKEAKANYAAEKKQEADAKARTDAAKKAQTNGPIVDDPDSQPLPNGPYTPPNPGHIGDPFAPGPQGSLPTPGTTPDR